MEIETQFGENLRKKFNLNNLLHTNLRYWEKDKSSLILSWTMSHFSFKERKVSQFKKKHVCE